MSYNGSKYYDISVKKLNYRSQYESRWAQSDDPFQRRQNDHRCNEIFFFTYKMPS